MFAHAHAFTVRVFVIWVKIMNGSGKVPSPIVNPDYSQHTPRFKPL